MEHLNFCKYVCMKKNLKDRFLSDKELIVTKYIDYQLDDKTYQIVAEEWLDTKTCRTFFIHNINNIVDLFLIPTDSNIFVNRDFLDVTNNPKFEVNNICNNSVVVTNTYIEGADGTGKTTAVNGLAAKGIMTIDRCVEHITRIMNQNDRQLIVDSVGTFLKNNPKTKVIFLYVSDKDEHYKRVYNRELISEYDKTAFELQEKYLYAYEKLKKYKNLYLIDTYNKTPEQVQVACEAIALGKDQATDSEIIKK